MCLHSTVLVTRSSQHSSSLTSLLTKSAHVSLSFPLPRLNSPNSNLSVLHTGEFKTLLCTCPNHISRYSLILSSIGTTLTKSRIFSFLILSLNMCSLIHQIIRISVMFILFISCVFTAQCSVAYNVVGLITVI